MRKTNKMKQSIPGVLVVAIFLLLCCQACSPESSESVASDVAQPYRGIFSDLEKGNYEAAQKTIEKKVLGNIERENEAEEVCAQYTDDLYDKFNQGEISEDKINLIIDAANRTDFGTYFENAFFEQRIVHLKMSKNSFATATELYENGDTISAINLLLGVIPDDTNYSTTVEMLTELMAELTSFDAIDDLKIASQSGESIMLKLENEEGDGIQELYNSCLYARLKFAQALDAASQYSYAICEYSKLKYDSYEAYCRFAELLRQKNRYTSTDAGSYCIDEYGNVTLTEKNSIYWNVGASDIVQLCAGVYSHGFGYYSSYLALLDSTGTIDFTLGEDVTLEFDWLPTGSISHIVKVIRSTEDQLLLLNDSGNVSVYGQLGSKHHEILNWNDLIDSWYGRVQYCDSAYFGLTSDGRVLTTNEKLSHVSKLSNIVSLSYFETEELFPDGVIIALSGDGVAYYSVNGRSFNLIDETDIIAIAGAYALKSDNTLKKFVVYNRTVSAVAADIDSGPIKALFPCSLSSLNDNYLGSNAHALTADGESILLP